MAKQPTQRGKAGIPQFDLGPRARAGIFIKKMQYPPNADMPEPEHDVSIPHRDNHYLLFLLHSGKGRMLVDFEEVSFGPPDVAVICPGQVHQLLEHTETAGWVISFEPTLVPQQLVPVFEQLRFNRHMPHDPLLLSQLTNMAGILFQLSQGSHQPYTGQAMYAQLQAMLHLLANTAAQQTAGGKHCDTRSTMIEQAFFGLLNNHFRQWKKPADYAAALSVSVSHLNDTIRHNTGFSVSHHIQSAVLLEAKRQLYHTQLTVKEIAYALGYEDQGYFMRLFKKITGLTPVAFRQQFREG